MENDGTIMDDGRSREKLVLYSTKNNCARTVGDNLVGGEKELDE